MGVMYIAPRTCEKGWLCLTFSKRCALTTNTLNGYLLFGNIISPAPEMYARRKILLKQNLEFNPAPRSSRWLLAETAHYAPLCTNRIPRRHDVTHNTAPPF